MVEHDPAGTGGGEDLARPGIRTLELHLRTADLVDLPACAYLTQKCVLTPGKHLCLRRWPGRTPHRPPRHRPLPATPRKDHTMTIVVTGATGHLGRLVVESLLDRGVAPARSSPPAAPPSASPRSPTSACAPPSPTTPTATPSTPPWRAPTRAARLRQRGGTAGRAARAPSWPRAARAGVGLLGYTSIAHADTAEKALATDHRETERVIRESGVPFTFLRNSWYLENYLPQVPGYLEHGVVGASGDGRVSAATRADYADAAAAALLDPTSAGRTTSSAGRRRSPWPSWPRRSQPRAGARSATPRSRRSSSPQILVGRRTPPPIRRGTRQRRPGDRAGELEVTSGDLERLIGRTPTSLRDAVDAALATLTA